MTKKDYVKVAEAIKSVLADDAASFDAASPSAYSYGRQAGVFALASRLGTAFKLDNPNFDWPTFATAAGLLGETK